MIKLRFGQVDAAVEGGAITSPNLALAGLLADAARLIDRSGSDPDFDYTLAKTLATRYGGKIVSADPPPATTPGRIY